MTDKTQVPDADWVIPEELHGAHLDRIVRERFPEASWNQVRTWIRGGNVLVGERVVTEATATFEKGVDICVCAKPSTRKRTKDPLPIARSAKLIVHLDSQLVVAEKPSGISTVPYDASEKDTLERRVQNHLARGKGRALLHVVHRIDKETSGLLVFARTQHALLRLKSQFRFHTVERRYLALVHGHPKHATHKSLLVRDRGDGLRGSTTLSGVGREATTHVRVIERFAQASLVECRLETGRTHQIRIHLAEAGHPLLGEKVYIKGYAGPILEASRVFLHAASLGFTHPADERPLLFESSLPFDFEQRLSQLKKGVKKT